MLLLRAPSWTAALLALVACGSRQEAAVGVSTAPQSIPPPPAPPELPDASAAEPAATVDASAPPPVALGRLHPVTGMSMSGKKLDPKAVITRIEARPEALDACSAMASADPNAPDGSWNVQLVIQGGQGTLDVQSPVAPALAQCLHNAPKAWSLKGLADGSMMLLLGLAR